MSTGFGMCSIGFRRTPHSQIAVRGSRCGLSCAFACLLLLALASGNACHSARARPKKIAAARTESVDAKLFERVVAYIKSDLRAQVQTRKPLSEPRKEKPLPKLARHKLAKDLAASLADDEALLLVFVATRDARLDQATYVAGPVLIVDVAALRASLPTAKRNEVYARRVEKETMGGIAKLMGMKECPFKRCAASAWKTTKELDLKGRNFCPPCHGKALATLEKKGVPITRPRMKKTGPATPKK